ncbi:MAG: polysaccharide deacetylase family protein [Pseudomonadota bacterium]
MRLRGTTRLRRYGRRAIDALAPGGIILCYHRVAEPELDPWGLSVTPRHFEEHLEVIRRFGRAVRLDHFTKTSNHGAPFKGAVAITMDDGYLDNFEKARPLLEKHAVPATVFVVSGTMDSGRSFWWEELAALLLRPGTLPPTLELTQGGEVHRFELNDAVHYSPSDRARDRAVRVWQARPGSRIELYHRVWSLLQPLKAADQQRHLAGIRAWAGDPVDSGDGLDTMTARQLRELAEGGLIEVGGHTVSHPSLPRHDEDHREAEIEGGKAALEEMTGTPVTSFAYPYGDFCPATVRRVKASGYKRACSTRQGQVRGLTNPYLLPRYDVRDCTGEELSRRLFNRA